MYSLFQPATTRTIFQAYSRDKVKKSSRKKALVIGLNYFDSHSPDSGALADAHQFSNDLMLKLHVTDTQVLCDGPSTKVTKTQVLQAFETLIGDADEGDVLFFHFSGRSKDQDCMMLSEGSISNSELNAFLIEPMQAGVTLFIIMDSCYSGLGLRFHFEDNSKGPNEFLSHEGKRLAKNPEKWIPDCKVSENVQVPETHCSVVILSHSGERGLLSWGFSQVLESVYHHSLTFGILLCRMRAIFEANGSFLPAIMESGQYIDIAVPLGRLVSAPI